MKKTLIMWQGNDVKIYEIGEDDPIKNAKYQLQRRIEKEGWEADYAYLIDEDDKLPAEEWIEEYWDRQRKYEIDRREEKDKVEYQRLKRKFEAQ